jgi:SAM-dependent methyltransferase
MHPFQLGDDVYVGYFKYHGIEEQVCTSRSGEQLRNAMREAFADYMAGDPYWVARELLERFGTECSYLDIACATGKFSFALALGGAESVCGVEIRSEQVEQAHLLQELDERLAAARVLHDPTSADDPSFRAGESYDVVLSMGLLYHLTDPVQHLVNLRRLARRAAVVNTLTHANASGYWLSVSEDPAGLTKAVSGVSWIPHFADVPSLLRRCGFSRVELLVHPLCRSYQERLLKPQSRARKLATAPVPMGALALAARARAKRAQREIEPLLRAYQPPGYFTYLAFPD